MTIQIKKAIPALISLTAVLLFCPASTSATTGHQSKISTWREMPVLPALGPKTIDRIGRIVDRGEKRGLDRHKFMKVGDSHSWLPTFLQGAGCGPIQVAGRHGLAEVIRWYRSGRLDSGMTDLPCGIANSFSRDSAATKSCESSDWPLTRLPTPLPEEPNLCNTPPPTECEERGTPVGCEARLLRPALALVMIGTNDAVRDLSANQFEANLRLIVHALVSRSVVPVLSTLPPLLNTSDSVDRSIPFNARVVRVAKTESLPLTNLWRGLEEPSMIDHGLFVDGVHLSVLGGYGFFTWAGRSMELDSEAIRYGANLRNLITLQTLARLRQRTAL